MKKLLTVLGAITLVSSASASILAFGPTPQIENQLVTKGDVSKLITNTDLGLIKESEVIDGDYFAAINSKLAELNPFLNPDIFDSLSYVGNENPNGFIIDGTNLTFEASVSPTNTKYTGRVQINFSVEAGTKPFLTDINFLKHDDLGLIENFNKLSEVEQQQAILDAFFKANPAYWQDHDFFSLTVGFNPSTPWQGAAGLTLNSRNNNYDVRFSNTIWVTFTI